MLSPGVARKWLLAVALVVGLPLGALCQPPYLRAWTLLALECDWVLTSLWLSWRGVPKQHREPLWALVWLLLATGDILYNAWAADVPRYPAHYVPDLLFVAVALLLIVLVRRLRGAAHGTRVDEAVVALCAVAALGVEFYVVLGLPRGEPLPVLAATLTWAYAALSAWLTGELLLLTLRTSSWASFGRGLGLMLMLVGDLAQRHEAVMPEGPRQAGEAEVAWVIGLGLACLAHAAAELTPARQPISAWASARVSVGLLGPLSSASVICGAWAWGLLQLFAARDWAEVLSLAWLGWAASNAVALSLCRALGNLTPEPGASPEGWLKQLAQPSLPLGELTRWRLEHHRIAEQLVRALAAGRRGFQSSQALALAQQLAHDLGGPLMVLEQALVRMAAAEPDARPAYAHGTHAQGALLARRATSRLMLLAREARAKHSPELAVCEGHGSSVCVAALCQLAWQEAQQRHEAKNLRWHAQGLGGGDGWNIVAPVSAVCRALANLLDNAAQAVDAHTGIVRLAMRRERATLIVSVSDNGPGLSDAQKEHYGHGPLPSARGAGHGLGVWSASQALERAGGSLTHDKDDGPGWTVTMRLPQRELCPWVLIDDDELVQHVWQLRADDVGAQLVALDIPRDIENLRASVHRLPRAASVYIDCDLGSDVRGEHVATWCEQLGFTSVHLISGSRAHADKMPPF